METVEVEYSKLPRIRRLAIFLTVIGPENASVILRSFDDAEIEAIASEMVTLELIDEETQRDVLDEFSNLLLDSATSIQGGYKVALQTVENTRGAHRARSLASKLGLPSDAPSALGDFSEMGAQQMWNLIKGEQPQTIAFLLSAIDANKSAEILELMDEAMQTEIVISMGLLGPTSSEILEKVLNNLSAHTEGRMPSALSKMGGSQHLADVMKILDSAVSKTLLSAIDSADSDLGAAIHKAMFSFKDLVTLSQDAMQKVMREVDTTTMVMAMKNASLELKDMIYGSLSKRGAEALREELEMMGPARIKEVEAAQEIVLGIVRKLEEDGEISIGESGEDEYV